MEPIACKVIAAPVHQDWLRELTCRGYPGVQLYPGTVEAGHSVATLMLVGRDTLGWARSHLLSDRRDADPIVAIARDLSGAMIQGLLAMGVRDFIASERGGDELKTRLWRLRELQRATVAAAAPDSDDAALHPLFARLVGRSPGFVRQIERIPTMAASDAAVLILGETGTGKELCAQAIHYTGKRAPHPFVAVNCAALPSELVEAELFGNARGAYTSANQERGGLVAEAQGGSFFLDEIDSMPLAAQAKLLRFLQDKEYRPVGSAKARRADVRVIAASNSDLDVLVQQGRFRRDLYYRLDVLSIRLPPLRERMEDLPTLSQHFLRQFARECGREVSGLTSGALARLAAYPWPGNVRELGHALERAVLLSRGPTVQAADLDLPDAPAVNGGLEPFQHAKAQAVRAFERMYLERMLLLCQGNITHAAQASGKNRRAFWQLIRKHGIDAACFRQ